MRNSKEGGASKKRITRDVGTDRKGSGALRRLRHGIFLQEPVIPGVEKVREFRRFQSKVLEAMAPRNELQRWWARRIVRLIWRLNRVEVYEAAVIERGQQGAEDKSAEVVEQPGPYLLKTARSHLKLLKSLSHLAPETKVRGSEALAVLGFIADMVDVKLEEVVPLATAKAEDLASLLRHPAVKEWTRAEILEVISAIAHREAPEDLRQTEAAILEAISAIAHREDNAPDLRQAAAKILASHREDDAAAEGLRQAAVRRLMKILAPAEAIFAARDHRGRLGLLPDSDELNRVERYEAHLSRLLVRAVREYEALQAQDRGERIPVARLDIGGLA